MEVNLVQALVLAVAAGTTSVTITNSALFDRVRQFIEERSAFLGDLFHCAFCMSFWIVLLVELTYQPLLLSTGQFWPDVVVSWLALTGLASLVAALILRAYDLEL